MMKKKDVLLVAGGMLTSFVTGKVLGGLAVLQGTNDKLKEHGLEITKAYMSVIKTKADIVIQQIKKEEA